jgi:hypothetical protein
VDGGAWDEPSDVLWLQVGIHFCDLRTPLPRREPVHLLDLRQAFSGRVVVANGEINFHHDIDSLRRDLRQPDQSTVSRVGDIMFERGPGFEERWRAASLPEEQGQVAELRPAGSGSAVMARIVRIGPLALAVWGGRLPGGAQFHAWHGWEPERSLCRPGVAMAIEEAVRALGHGDPLPPDWAIVPESEA